MNTTMTNRSLLLIALVAGCSSEDPPAKAPVTAPAAPAGVTVERDGSHLVVRWTDASENEDAFVIARATVAGADAVVDASALVAITTVTADQVFLRDLAVEEGVFYAYGVAARNVAGDSAYTLQAGGAVDPKATVATGPCQVAVPSATDADGDGLDDEVEAAGWTVRIDETGQGTNVARNVASIPLLADSDEDGVCDSTEQILRTDPMRADTDADGLTDADELTLWGSSPINVDSDGDASGNTAFFDGAEVDRYGTSPTLADTDGDGRTDFDEVNQNGTNPLLADLPQPEIRLVGTMDLGINVSLENGTTEENAFSSALAQENESSVERTNSTATTVTTERSAEVGASVGASFPDGVSMSVSASYTQTEGLVKDASRTFTQGSRETSRSTYEQATTRAIERRETIEDGTIAMQIEIVNAGRRTFELSNLVLTAFTRSRDNPSSFTSIATLPMPAAGQTVTLSENETAGPFRLEADIPANVALDLLANPSGIFFRPVSFSLADRTGQNFEFAIGETTNNRTALLTIDFGGSRPVETYRIATNVAREAGGRLAGVRMADALESIVGLDASEWETAPNASGKRVLTRIHDVAATERNGGTSKFWAVIAAENGTSQMPVGERLLAADRAFEDLVLMPRDRVYLAYVSDEDGDGLFAREERLYGTADTNADSDGDGRTDFEEIREGWAVFSNLPFYAQYPRVFSSPTNPDADDDGIDDPAELAAGTDPNRADTDGDGLADGEDPEPLLGLSPPAIFTIGSTSLELGSGMAVDGAGNVYITGPSLGDLDNDGRIARNDQWSSGRYVTKLGPDGERRWMIELEDLPPNRNQNNIHIDASGQLVWLERLDADDLPGVTASAPHLVTWDANGVLTGTTRVVYAVTPGVATTFSPNVFQPLPGGGYAALGTDVTTFGRVRLLIFDAAGAVSASRTWEQGSSINDFLFSVTPSGNMFVFDGCRIRVHDQTAAEIDVLDFCADAIALQAAYEDSAGDIIGVSTTGTIIKRSFAGAELWRSVPSAEANPYPSHVDRLGRIYALSNPFSGPKTLKCLLPNGAESFTSSIDAADLLPSAMTVDGSGNLYLLGSTDSGLGGRVRPVGGYDVVLIRNPQLLFDAP